MSGPDPRPTVAALLVSHDGARWLPTALAGLAAQQVRPDLLVAIDTGSGDDSVDLVRSCLEEDRLPGVVLHSEPGEGFAGAVRAGLVHLRGLADPPEWVWLLHDDATAAPDALDALLAAARDRPDVDLLGPKLREWPSLKRLLELGVTISGTGRRETGLEPGEYDQGQHDQRREVLAVNTAGLLVRRRTLEELGGLDPALALFGNDVDLGWRAATRGHTTLVVPDSVLFHAEAATRGVRRTALTGPHPRRQQRRAALWTLLANCPPRRLPLQVVRLTLGTLLRAVGLLLLRAPREAGDDVAALVSVLGRPRQLRDARRRRVEGLDAPLDHQRARSLLPPFWLPWRHGLDALADLATALANQASDVAERRRTAAAERDPGSAAARRSAPKDPDVDEAGGGGALARLAGSPVAVLSVVALLVLLVAARAALGPVSGGGLSPAPEAAGRWWSLYLESWHELGQGTAVPAPPYLLALAVPAAVLGPGAVVSLVMLLAAPVALWGAFRMLSLLVRLVVAGPGTPWLPLLGAIAYAVVPFVSGAWAAGRLGTVVAAAVLPWLVRAAVGLVDPDPDRRWRAAWRTALLLALLTCFAPTAWFAATTVVGLALAVLLARAPAARSRSAWGPPVAALITVPVLLAPWWVPLLAQDAAAGLLLPIGRQPGPTVPGAGLLLGRLGETATAGGPAWLGVLLLVLATLALAPRVTRLAVLGCWAAALAVALTALLVSAVPLRPAGLDLPPGTGVLLVAWQGCLVAAAVLGGQGLLAALGRAEGRPSRALLAAAAVVAAVVPVGGLAWAVVDGGGDLGAREAGAVPAYMVQSAMTGPEHGVLVLRGSVAEGLDYVVLRDDGLTVGEDEVLALTPADAGLGEAVTALVSRPRPSAVADLAAAGVEYVVMPSPVDGSVAAGLDATGGLARASAEDRATGAWQVEPALDPAAVSGSGPGWRAALLVLQLVALVVVVVLAAPTARRRGGLG